MKRNLKIVVTLWGVLLLATLWTTQAKSQEEKWSIPLSLSTEERKGSEGSIVADKYGYAHLFWTEVLEDERMIIQYARFDGKTWTTPVDVHVTETTINAVSPFVDQNGTLHLVWTEGSLQNGPAYYSSAPSYDALSAKKWQKPIRILIPAKSANLLVDSQGIIHLVYVKSVGSDLGLYYVRSSDQGRSWSKPTWIDPDIPLDYVPRSVHFAFDENDGLHAAWYYAAPLGGSGDWVRYAHSLDGGDSWSSPFTLDKDEEETGRLWAANPVMTVQGRSVHVIWASGDTFLVRYHRYSTDAGQTWGVPVRFMGDLNGQAFDGIAVDGKGRVHYFAQIRYPMGIWHAYWDQGRWTTPSLIYLIKWSDSEGKGKTEGGSDEYGDEYGDKIGAHHTHPTVLTGNQLVLSFADEPSHPLRGLYFIQYTMPAVPPSAIEPTPVLTATPSPTSVPSPTPTPRATQTPTVIGNTGAQIAELPAADYGFMVGVIIPLFLVGGTVGIQIWLRRRY